MGMIGSRGGVLFAVVAANKSHSQMAGTAAGGGLLSMVKRQALRPTEVTRSCPTIVAFHQNRSCLRQVTLECLTKIVTAINRNKNGLTIVEFRIIEVSR